jgi:hypothetical protein
MKKTTLGLMGFGFLGALALMGCGANATGNTGGEVIPPVEKGLDIYGAKHNLAVDCDNKCMSRYSALT